MMPVVQPALINTIGEQLLGNHQYVVDVEAEVWEENAHLAAVINASLTVLENVIEDPDVLVAAKTIGTTTALLVYQAIKQQLICDELS